MIVIDNSNAINLKKIRIWFAGKSLLIPKPVSLKKSRKPKLPGYKLFCIILCNRFDYRFGNRKYRKIKGLHGKLLQIRYKPRTSHSDWGHLSFSRVLISARGLKSVWVPNLPKTYHPLSFRILQIDLIQP